MVIFDEYTLHSPMERLEHWNIMRDIVIFLHKKHTLYFKKSYIRFKSLFTFLTEIILI